MLYQPITNLRSKRGYFGIVTSNTPHGPRMRALAFPVQTLTRPAVNWRHIFLTAKRNWASLLANGTQTWPASGLTDTQLWDIVNGSYNGILQAGLIENGVMTMPLQTSCVDGSAYYQMVQTNRASLGMSALRPPTVVSQYLAFPTSPATPTLGNFAATITGQTAPSGANPAITLTVQVQTTSQTNPPLNIAASGPTLVANIGDVAQLASPGPLYGPASCTAIAGSGHTSFTFDGGLPDFDYIGSTVTTTGFSVAGFNVTNAVIISYTPFAVIVAGSVTPGTLDVGGTGTITDPNLYIYEFTVTAQPSNATSAGSIPLTLSLDDDNGTQTTAITLAATAGTPRTAQPPPTFAYPNGMTATTVYDSAYNVFGFHLTYTWFGGLLYPMDYGGTAYGGLWEVIASPAYKQGGTAPDATTWSPILFAGPSLPGPAQVSAAWQNVFGVLPQSGSIKFQMFPLDPLTGASGPPLSATAGWKAGTLNGASRAAITGPLFAFGTDPGGIGISVPGSASTPFTLYGMNGYGGTITYELKSSTVMPTGYNNTKKFLPQGITVSFSPPSVTIAPGDTTPHTVTLTVSAVTGAQQFSGNVRISATDGSTTTSRTFSFGLTGAVTPQPPPNYLFITPGGTTSPSASPSVNTVLYTLENDGPGDIQVSMQAACSLASIDLSFDNTDIVVPGAPSTAQTVPPYVVPCLGADGVGGSCNYNGDFDAVGDFAGWYLTASGSTDPLANGGPWLITAASFGTVTCNNPNNPHSPGTAVTITITNPSHVSNTPPPQFASSGPGTATATLTIDIPAGVSAYGTPVQVSAAAGANTAQAGLFLA